jgi:hypothetical protein
MKINNKTNYPTRELKKVFDRCIKELVRTNRCSLTRFKNLDVKITTRRVHSNTSSSFIGGYAYYNSCWCEIKLPNKGKPLFGTEIADTFIHEIGHCLGIKHNAYGCYNDTIEHFYKDWIDRTFKDMMIPPKEIKKVIVNHVDVRYQRAKSNLEKAETRLKRAKTIFKKWTNKVKYYEKKLNNKNG